MNNSTTQFDNSKEKFNEMFYVQERMVYAQAELIARAARTQLKMDKTLPLTNPELAARYKLDIERFEKMKNA